MRTTTLSVTVKRTIQTASYESSSVEITETVELEEDDEVEECRAEVYKSVTKGVKKAIDNEFRKYMNSQEERAKEKKNAK
jgi:hypothetical protein